MWLHFRCCLFPIVPAALASAVASASACYESSLRQGLSAAVCHVGDDHSAMTTQRLFVRRNDKFAVMPKSNAAAQDVESNSDAPTSVRHCFFYVEEPLCVSSGALNAGLRNGLFVCIEGATISSMGPSLEPLGDDSNTRRAAARVFSQPQSPAIGRTGSYAMTKTCGVAVDCCFNSCTAAAAAATSCLFGHVRACSFANQRL